MLDDLQAFTDLTLLTIGRTTVTVGGLVAALLVFVLGLVAARLVTAGLRRVRSRGATSQSRAMIYLVEKIFGYGLAVLGTVAAFSTLGLDLSALAVFAGALGIGVGLGLQGVVKEFVSGLVLIFDRVINIGDFVELENGQRGAVQEIGPRATRIATNDNIHLLVPNSHLIETMVINWTLRDGVRRIHVPFGVAYGADKARVRDAVLEAAFSVPFTLPDTADRKTQVWLVGFGDSSLNFELVVWPTLEACKRPAAMQAAYTWAIDDALRKADIEVPFPQRDVRVRAVFGREGDEAIDALGMKPQGRADIAAGRVLPPAPNDAADDLERPAAPEKDGEGG